MGQKYRKYYFLLLALLGLGVLYVAATWQSRESESPIAPSTPTQSLVLLRPREGFYEGYFFAARAGARLALDDSKEKSTNQKLTLAEIDFAKLDNAREALAVLFAGPESDRRIIARWGERNKIPVFLLNAGQCLTESAPEPGSVSPFVFQTGLTWQSSLEPLLIHLNEKYARPGKDFSIYYFGGDNAENRILLESAILNSEALGFKTVAKTLIDTRLADYYSIARNVIIDRPEVLFISNPDLAGQLFLEQATKLQLDQEMKLASLNSFDEELFQPGSKLLSSTFTAASFASSLQTKEAQAFVESLSKQGVSQSLIGSTAHAGYVSVSLLREGLAKLRAKKATTLSEALGDLEIAAPNGLVQMNPKNHILEQPLFIVHYENGSWKVVDSLGSAVHPGLEGCRDELSAASSEVPEK